MTRTARLFVLLGAAMAVAAFAPARAAYPDKPIKIVVGFPPGSTGDLIARALAPRLGENLGQAVIVENRTGAGSSIAAESVARSPSDGYTLLLSTTANVINQSVSSNLKFDFTRDLMPVILIAENPVLLVAPAASSYSSVAALTAAAKAAPGKFTYASSGNGTFTHLYGELFNQSAGIKLNHVPYRGSTQAITDVLSGQVDLAFTPATPVLGQVKGGRLTVLAVIGKARMAALPEVPTFAEAGIPGFDLALWFGLHAPAGTPAAVIEKLNTRVARVLETADVKGLLAGQSVYVVGDGPVKFAEQISRENTQWARIVKTADIKAD
jgi:tripartite-type tricarboxylate transporter receptor subunit TctC